MGDVTGAVNGMGVSEAIRHEDVDGHPRQSSRGIAEHRFGAGVGRDDPARRVGHDGGVGHQPQDGVDELRRVRVGDRHRAGVRVRVGDRHRVGIRDSA